MTTDPLPPLKLAFWSHKPMDAHEILSDTLYNDCAEGLRYRFAIDYEELLQSVHAREDAVKDNLVKIYENMSIANVDLMQKEIQSLIEQLERKE